MLNVTTLAKTEIFSLLMDELENASTAESGSGRVGFRIVRSDGRLGLSLDCARTDDDTVEVEGWPILLIDATTSDSLEGRTLDVIVSDRGPALALV